MARKTIFHEDFRTKLTLEDSYKIMCEFIKAFHERGEVSTFEIYTYTSLLDTGESNDPAQIHDYLVAANKVLNEKT